MTLRQDHERDERDLENLTDHLDKKNTSRFVDAVELKEKKGLELDEDAQNHLTELKVNKVPKTIEVPKERKHKIAWKGVNLEESKEEEHHGYLQKFCRQFVNDMKDMIKVHLENKDSEMMDEEDMALFHEIVHHAKFANDKLTLFCGREESLAKIKQILTTKQERNIPIVIHAKSGHGKTSLLAKCASRVPEWLGEDTAVVLRFLGTSPKCSNIRDTIVSVISQMSALLNYTLPQKEKLEKMGEVRRFFNLLIKRIGELHSDQKFVIILDSIDQLSELYGAHRFSWLPRTLPSNVHIVISLLSDFGSILSNCENRVSAKSQYIELEPLSKNTAKDIIQTFMAFHKRTLTKEQQNLILGAFQKNAQPLFLKLVLDQALQWNSYTPVADIQIATNVRNAIQILFTEMESKYGEVFVRHALSYLTCGNGGLTDIEMDDILSCDDEVLNEVYKYHDPPLEGIIRIPALLWARLGNELNEYLTEKQVDNKTVRTWYHRQFLETSEEHYLAHHTHYQKMHSNLAELFLQTSGIKRTITLTQRKGKVIEDADRRVAPQALSVANLRKLNSLPYHLFRGKQFQSLSRNCLLDFDFVFTKIRSIGISAIFAEFSDIVTTDELLNDPAVVLMKDFLELTFDALHLDSNLFPFFAKDRLGAYKEEDEYKRIVPMIECAEKWLSETKQPMLLPTNPLNMTSLNSPIKFSQLLGLSGEVSSNEEVAVCLWKEAHSNHSKINVFDLLGRETIATIELGKETPTVITPDNKNFLFWNWSKLCLHELYTGDKVLDINILDREYEVVTPKNIGISADSRWLILVLKIGKPKGIAEGEAWKNQSVIFCVDMTSIETELSFTSQAYSSRRAIEKFIFVDDNSKVVALKRDGIQVFALPQLNELSGQSVRKGVIAGSFAAYAAAAKVIVEPVIQTNGCNCFIYNWTDNTLKFSSLFHCEETGDKASSLTSFGTIPKPDISMVLIGTNDTGDSRNTRLWVWDTVTDAIKRIVLSDGIWRIAMTMIVMNDWDHVIIGYQSGDLTLVSISKEQGLRDVHAHGNAITTIQLYNHSRNLLTMATDHSLKLWDVKKLFTGKDDRQRKPDAAYGYVPLDTQEQVLELDCNDKHAITVSQLTKQGTRFWNLDSGLMDVGVTIPHEEIYQGVLKEFSQMGGPRYHGAIELVNDYVIYQRKRRDGFLLYIAQAYDQFAPQACQFFEDSFFTLATKGTNGSKPLMFIVRDGSVEKRTIPNLELIKSVKTPRISDEIPNLESKRAKRKLIYYKVGITMDGKNFIICNPSPNQMVGKYFDWIDAETMTYKGRIPLPGTTSWKLLEDSFCFLVAKESSNDAFIYRPSLLPQFEEKTYTCPIYGGNKGVLSQDSKLGIEIYRDHAIVLWNIQPLCKLHILRGHTSDVNSTCISKDNKFVASGSFDNTVRLWSVEKGTSLCLFHLYGNVNGVQLTPNKDYIVAKYYSAPQRTRAAILKVWNVEK